MNTPLHHKPPFWPLLSFWLLFLLLAGCTGPATTPAEAGQAVAVSTAAATATGTATPALPLMLPPATETSTPDAALPPLPTATATPALPTATPFPTSVVTPGPAGQCGMLLPVVPGNAGVATTSLPATLPLTGVPEEVLPAVEFIRAYPEHVGLVAYRVGEEADGLYLNPDVPMPLASVVKIIHLVAYVDAVFAGELDPQTPVLLSELERYYLPGSDLGGHTWAVQELEAEEHVFGEPPAVRLEDVPRMMMQYSSNAATDYLHFLLGQERIERTVLRLGLTRQTAPCPFIGQFLVITNPAGELNDQEYVQHFIDDPALYSNEVMELATRFATDATFRNQIGTWRGRNVGPDFDTQRLFSQHLNPHGSALDYANLMSRIAQNQLGPWELNVMVRRYLEWPTFFDANQQQMAWTGYKGGSLPGILTAAYYAQPWWRTQPVVVVLFLRDLPDDVYREWRRDLPHDELARWLMREPQALPLLKSILLP